MFGRRRYGTPLHAWARPKRSRLPRMPRGSAEWSAALSKGSNWIRGGIVAFVVWIAGSSLVGAIVPPPLPDLAATNGVLSVEGVVMPRLEHWALWRPNPGLDRPWIYYAPGSTGKPPTTISIYAPVVTERIAAITAEAGAGTLNREQYLERIIAAWVADTEDSTSIPTPTLSPITTGVEGERIELASLLEFDEPFAWSPPVATPAPSTVASPTPTPAESPAAENDNGLGPILALPATGPDTEQRVVVKIALYLPSVASFDSPGLQRMLVIALSYDASMSSADAANVEQGFRRIINSIEFP